MFTATVVTRRRGPTKRDPHSRIIATYGRATRTDLYAFDPLYSDQTNHKRGAIYLARAIWTTPRHLASYRLGTSLDKFVHVFEY